MILLARFRSSLIRPSLRLVAVGSLVAAVALFTYALQTSAQFDAESAGSELAGTVQADSDAPDFSATNAPVSSSMIAAAASARAQAQLDALRTDTSLEWAAGLTPDSGFTDDAGLSSTTVEGIDHLALLVDVNPWAAEWLPIEDTPLTLADVAAHRFGGVGFGGGASGLSGGGVAGGGSGAGEISGRSAGASDTQSTLQTPRAQQPGGDDHESGRPSERSAQNSGDSRADDWRGDGNDGASIASVARGFDAPPGSREPVSVPEPSSAVLAALGLASLAATRLRRRAGR
jgi:PEP-CTERM motif